jgi:DNA polymerase
MKFITLDFETYYSRDYSLTKLTTEEYIRNDLFEVIGVGVKVNDEDPVWFSGGHAAITQFLQSYDWSDATVIAHNAMFDAAILTWAFGIIPFRWICTLSIARAVDGMEVGNSLKALAEKYKLGVKGTEVVNALGKHRTDFTRPDLSSYGEYCKNDCDLTWKLFGAYMDTGRINVKELRTIDSTVRMFSEPVLRLDLGLLQGHLIEVKEHKKQLMEACESNSEILQSNPKFAELLRSLGVNPPTKISTTTGKETFAFAKSDQGLKDLLEHPDVLVQAVVAARLGVKSTLEETRTERLIGIAQRGTLPVPLKYYAARTGRWGGSDKLNLQNLPSRGTNTLKNAIQPPKGYGIINCDSSQIEARVLAWLAGQLDLVQAFADKLDVYKVMASKIYGKPIKEITDPERFMGKTVVLGCGYGLGALRFQISLLAAGIDLDLDECQRIINTYRDENQSISRFWRQANDCLGAMLSEKTFAIGKQPQAITLGHRLGFKLPNGLRLGYPDLRREEDGYSYKSRAGRVKIYGGKVVENLCQAIARCIIAEQINWVAERYKVVLTVHDAIVIVAKEDEMDDAKIFIEEKMRKSPKWASDLPLNCESKSSLLSYGECK